MTKNKTFFFTLSGDNLDLAEFEIISIFKLKNANFFNKKLLDRFLILSSERDISNILASRVALTHNISELLLECSFEEQAIEQDIIKSLKTIDFNLIIKNKKTFAVRIKKIGYKSINPEYFERLIGKIIYDQLEKKVKVNLNEPEMLFYGIFVKNEFIFGINYIQNIRSSFTSRALKFRPFFHPSALNPYLARVMVNLAQIKEEDILFDPFCGTGSILIEAFLVGCSRIIGNDINNIMINGSKKNLKEFGINNAELLLSDSNHIPLREISAIVTDPPYGISSSTHKKTLPLLLENFFLEISDLILNNGLIVLALPSHIQISNILDKIYFKIINKFEQYYHPSLTREIYIIQKNKKRN